MALEIAGRRDSLDPMERKHPGVVEDYTNAFLVSFGVVVFIALFAVWAVWGLIGAGLVSWLADRAMLRRRRSG